MTKLEKAILNSFIETGRAVDGWKVEVIGTEQKHSRSDWCSITVNVTKKRCRKPFISWTLLINMAREQIWYDKSSFVYL